jgi:hypothetical protein
MDLNPYAPPRPSRSHDVRGERHPRQAGPGRLWRIYAVLWALLWAVGCVFTIRDELGVLGVADIALSIPGVVGLFGYAYRHRFLTRRPWSVWAILLPLWDLTYAFALNRPSDGAGRIGMALGLLLCVPEYVALWRYAHRSEVVWNPKDGAAVVAP